MVLPVFLVAEGVRLFRAPALNPSQSSGLLRSLKTPSWYFDRTPCIVPMLTHKIKKTANTFGAAGIFNGGGGEIRTHEGREPLPVFKTGAFNHSATPPRMEAPR